MFGFHPVPKPSKRDIPQFKEKRPKKQTIKGREVPSKKTRGRVTTVEYNEALRQHGETCYFCNSSNIEMHHVKPKKYSGESGRGVWRNLRALCPEHHRGENGVHGKNGRKLLLELQEVHKRLYGPHYYHDRFDLFALGLIPNTTKESYESFMEVEREKVIHPPTNGKNSR
jgi:YHS domain-containing protein